MAEVTWQWYDAGYDHGFAKGLARDKPSFFDFTYAWDVYQAYDGHIKGQQERVYIERQWAEGFLKGWDKGSAAQPSSNFETMDWPDSGHAYSYGLVTKYNARLSLRVFKMVEAVLEPMNFNIHIGPITEVRHKTRDVWYFRLKNRRCSGPYPTEAGAIDMAHSYLASLGFRITSRNENLKVSSVYMPS